MIFLHPSEFEEIKKGCLVLTEEDYQVLQVCILHGKVEDLEKAGKNFASLQKVVTPIVRGGKIVMETYYINPNKSTSEKFKQSYRKGSEEGVEQKEHKGKEVVLHSQYSKGDKVKLKLQDGTEAVGTFRKVVNINGKDKAVIRTEIKDRKTGELKPKTVDRNFSEIQHLDVQKLNQPDTPETKVVHESDYGIGDQVTMSLRKRDENGKVNTIEVPGVLVRKTIYGFVVMTPDGAIYDRPVSTLLKVEDSKASLTKEQQVLLNKAIKSIKVAINEKKDIIDVLERRKPSNYLQTIDKINSEIEKDKLLQQRYYQVHIGEANFDDVVINN